MCKSKKLDNKGFSLVELIVVIAIMAVLITMLVPNVVGYIKKAQWASELGMASTIYSSAQTIISDRFADGTWHTNKQVSLTDLKNAGFINDKDIDKCNSLNMVVETDEDRPAVVKVKWDSANNPDPDKATEYPYDD